MNNNYVRISAFTGMILILTLITLGCSGSKHTMEDQSMTQPMYNPVTTEVEADYRIRTGDEIEILVWQQPSFNTLTTVSRMGTIAIPLAGEIEVTGLTQSELQRELERRLSQYIKGDIELTISIRSTDGLMVSIFGMVTRPDNYPVVDKTSIFRILATAGGPTPEANLRTVKVYRNKLDQPAETLDLTYYLEHGDMNAEQVMIYPGDIVYIDQKENVVREMSEFLRDVVILFGIFRVFN